MHRQGIHGRSILGNYKLCWMPNEINQLLELSIAFCLWNEVEWDMYFTSTKTVYWEWCWLYTSLCSTKQSAYWNTHHYLAVDPAWFHPVEGNTVDICHQNQQQQSWCIEKDSSQCSNQQGSLNLRTWCGCYPYTHKGLLHPNLNNSTDTFPPDSWIQLSGPLVLNTTVSIPASSWVIWNLVHTIPTLAGIGHNSFDIWAGWKDVGTLPQRLQSMLRAVWKQSCKSQRAWCFVSAPPAWSFVLWAMDLYSSLDI